MSAHKRKIKKKLGRNHKKEDFRSFFPDPKIS